jgi:Domain of unknown function (DUF4062)
MPSNARSSGNAPRDRAEASRPRVFVSSTIFDFQDLRSALKFWMLELGYEPLLSEHNDFPKPLDTDSYSACLSSIDTCEYFVLLIGSRLGGLYDASRRISITRAEYQYAYSSFKRTGRPRIITFVRRSVLDVKEDRKTVAKAEAKRCTLARLLWWHTDSLLALPSGFVDDPEATFAFIDEVRRADEMRAAVAKGSGFPPGNWVHAFDDFAEIVDVLRRQFRMTGSLRRAVMVASLKHELLESLRAFLHGKEEGDTGNPMVTHHWAAPARLKFAGDFKDTSTYSRGELVELGIFQVVATKAEHVSTATLDEVITSGEFLDWDRESQTVRVGPLQAALLRLRRELYLLRRQGMANGTLWAETMAFLQRNHDAKRPELEEVTVPNQTLAMVFALQDRHINIVRLISTILVALEREPPTYEPIDLQPLVLFQGPTKPFSLDAIAALARAEAAELGVPVGMKDAKAVGDS